MDDWTVRPGPCLGLRFKQWQGKQRKSYSNGRELRMDTHRDLHGSVPQYDPMEA
jgi:hypothetical protein